MINIRHNVFETNSSSSHSFSISYNGEALETLEMDEDGIITFYGRTFGWEIETYTDAYTKALYCFIDVINDPYRTKILIDLIKEHTGARDIVLEFGDDFSPTWAYIDHQSKGLTFDMYYDLNDLKQFIFNPNSKLMTDNDNHD